MADFVFENLLPYWYMWTVGILLAVISVGFVLRFVRPAAQIGRQLAASLAALFLPLIPKPIAYLLPCLRLLEAR